MSFDDDYIELETIGTGSYGQCSLVQEKSTNQIYVAKKLQTKDLPSLEYQRAKQEAELLNQLQHPNIVSYKKSYMEPGKFIIVMEYCQEGDLGKIIKKLSDQEKHFTEQQIINWVYQLTSALDFIHSKNILHRDIKATNIFLTSDGTAKLGDFGISKVLSHTFDVASTFVGTPIYMSPELCQQDAYASKSDVWALGCVFYEMCALVPPFSSSNLLALIQKITKDEPEGLPGCYSNELAELVFSMLKKDPDSRLSSQEILESSLFNDLLYNPMVSVETSQLNLLGSFLNSVEPFNNNEANMLGIAVDKSLTASDFEGSIDDEVPQDEMENDFDDENVVIHTKSTLGAYMNWSEQEMRGRNNDRIILSKRREAVKILGDELFYEIYELLRMFRRQNTEEDIVRNK